MENNWYPENPLFIDGHSIARPIHPGCLPVAAALKECAGLLFKEFALVVLNENGEENVYTSAALTPHQRRIFTDRFKVHFRSSVREALAREPGQDSLKDHLYNEHRDGRSNIRDSLPAERIRRHSQLQLTPTCFAEDDSAIDGKRKRAISSTSCDSYPDGHSIATPTRKTRRLVISDEGGVESFYLVRFKEMQQSACKIMGKAFVKFVEPKKQSHYPYSKGDIAAPPWWPDTKGNRSVRHKEPDHLLRPERIRLLVHILRMVAGPRDKQCAAVQKLDLNVKKLEEATMKSMSSWFNDSEHTENSSKEVLLKGIFKVAKAEERYKKREIDDTTCIFVTYDNKYRVDDPDDDEPGEDIEEVDESHQACLVPAPSSTPGPSFSPVTRIPNRPPQPNDFYGMHKTQFGPNIQNQSDSYIPSDNGPYPSSRLPPQGVADFDLSRRTLPSFTSYPQQRNTYDCENGTVGRDPTSTSTSSQPSMPHTASYRFPLPSSEHQFETSGYLSQPSLPRAYFQG